MILADENIHTAIIRMLRETGIEVVSVGESHNEFEEIGRTVIYLLNDQTLKHPFFATITPRKIRLRQL